MSPNQILVLFFVIVVLLLMILDMRSLFKYDPEVKDSKNALLWTGIWICTAMVFSVLVWYEKGFEKFTEFQSAYWIEQSLSVDNLFVFLLVLSSLKSKERRRGKCCYGGFLGP